MSLKVFSKKSIKFGCTKCGKCCSGSPGYVWLSDEDIQNLCEQLKLDRKTFCKRYTRLVSGKRSLLETDTNYACIFLKNNQCTVYKSRPKQCRTFPFWPSLLENKASWEEAKTYCEGIDHEEGKVYTKKEIEDLIL